MNSVFGLGESCYPDLLPFYSCLENIQERKKPTKRREVVLSGVLCPSRPVGERCRWTGLLGPERCDNNLILEGCTRELRTHFLERKVRTLDVEEFQELGVAFQAAHGRAKHVDFSADRKKFGSASHEDDSSTMLDWKVEVKREAAELDKTTKMSLKERCSYASEERLCFNCLRKGHPYWK